MPNQSKSSQVIGIGIVFNSSGKVLIDKRMDDAFYGGSWEFPGGKQKLGELIEDTIFRELKEELAIEVEVRDLIVSFQYSYGPKKLFFIVHACKLISGTPQTLASQQIQWEYPNKLSEYEFPEANTIIISELLAYVQRMPYKKSHNK